ncbi:hypothetical protein Tco_0699439 [Tanacetum coccineum]
MKCLEASSGELEDLNELEILKRLSIFGGRIIEIKRLHDNLEVTSAKIFIIAAKQNLVMFINSNENVVVRVIAAITKDYNCEKIKTVRFSTIRESRYRYATILRYGATLLCDSAPRFWLLPSAVL